MDSSCALNPRIGGQYCFMVGNRMMGTSRLLTGDTAEGRAHLDRAIALYDPVQHRPLATRLGQDVRVSILSYRSFALWSLGYPAAALADADHAKDAREIGHAASLMFALAVTSCSYPARKLCDCEGGAVAGTAYEIVCACPSLAAATAIIRDLFAQSVVALRMRPI
jgi:hypothetical protein